MTASEVPVPKMRPSGWNWAQVRAVVEESVTLVTSLPVFRSEKAQCWSKEVEST